MTQQTQQQIGLSGGIHGYDVIVLGDLLTVTDRDGLVSQQTVEGQGAFIATAGAIRLGCGCFDDDMGVLYLYDKGDRNFGYALKLLAD